MSLEREHVTNVLTKDKVEHEAQLISARFMERRAMIVWGIGGVLDFWRHRSCMSCDDLCT